MNLTNHPKGINSHAYKHGKCLQKAYCIDCGKLLCKNATYYGTERCRSCSQKMKWKNKEFRQKITQKNSGINASNYIDGHTLIEKHCEICNKIISFEATHCKSCRNLGKKLSKETKDKIRVSHIGLLVGKENGNWQGGIDDNLYPIEFNIILKESIRDRDEHTCQLCHTKEKDLSEKLSVHHIDYNKENCKIENLISLCNSCHTITNFNRDYYFAYFKYLMEELYVSI